MKHPEQLDDEMFLGNGYFPKEKWMDTMPQELPAYRTLRIGNVAYTQDAFAQMLPEHKPMFCKRSEVEQNAKASSGERKNILEQWLAETA